MASINQSKMSNTVLNKHNNSNLTCTNNNIVDIVNKNNLVVNVNKRKYNNEESSEDDIKELKIQEIASAVKININDVSWLDTFGYLDKDDSQIDIFSMKFPKPRNPQANKCPDLGLSDLELARLWVRRSMGHDLDYHNYIGKKIDSLTRERKEKERIKRIERKEVTDVNLFDNQAQTLSYLSIKVNGSETLALVDTGASRNLVTTYLTDKWHIPITKRQIYLRTANGVSKDLVKGICTLPITFTDYNKAKRTKTLPFLVASSLNGHAMILGSPLLRNSIIAVTTFILPYNDELHCIPLYHKDRSNKNNNIAVCVENIVISPDETKNVECHVYSQECFIKNNKQKSEPNDCSDKHAPTTPVSLGLIYKLDESISKQTKILNRELHIVNDKATMEIKNSSNDKLVIKKNKPIVSYLVSKMDEHSVQAITDLVSGQSNLQAGPLPEKVHINNTNKQLADLNITSINQSSDYSSDFFNSKFAGSNHSKIETVDDLMDHDSFAPLEEFSKVHKLSDIDYSSCPHDFKDRAMKLVNNYPDCFSKHKLDVGNCSERNGIYMDLETIKDKVSCDKKRPLSGIHLEYAEKVVACYVKAGLMAESYDSPFRANLNIVRKKSSNVDSFAQAGREKIANMKKLRLVFDVRNLNQITKTKTPSSLPTIDSVHHKMRGKYVIVSDLNNAFSHLRIRPSDAHKTSFYLNHKVYKCLMVVQGLTNSPYVCTKFTNIVFSQERFKKSMTLLSEKDRKLIEHLIIDDFLEVYMDDVFVFHENPEILLILYEAFLIMCRLGDVKMAPSKTSILTTKLNILGIYIDTMDGTLSLDQEKIKSLIEVERPNSLFALHSRLAQFLYIVKYLPLLQYFLYPLSLLLKCKVFTWTRVEEESWQALLLLIKLNVKLAIPDKHENLLITSDASRYALGGALFADRPSGLALVQVTSKINSINNYHKSSYILELQALHLSLATFWPYLVNCRGKIYIFSDMRAILFLRRMSSHNLLVQNLLDNIVFRLQQLDVIISHAPGSILLMADMLSRSFEGYFKKETVHPLSKVQAENLPAVPNNCTLTADDLLIYLTRRPREEKGDIWDRDKKHSGPPKIDDLFRDLKLPSPEERYLTVLKLLAGHDKDIEYDINTIHIENIGYKTITRRPEIVFLNELISNSNKELSAIYMDRLNHLLSKHFSELKKSPLLTRLRRSLDETYKCLLREQHNTSEELDVFLKEKFTKVNSILEEIQKDIDPEFDLKKLAEQETTKIAETNFLSCFPKGYNRPAHIRIWTQGKTGDIMVHKDYITINITKPILIDRDLPREEPLGFYLEIQDHMYAELSYKTQNKNLSITMVEQNPADLTTIVRLSSTDKVPTLINSGDLSVLIKLKSKDRNKVLNLETLVIQIQNIFELPSLYILDKISFVHKSYSHQLKGNHYINKDIYLEDLANVGIEDQQPTEPELPEIKYDNEELKIQQLLAERDIRSAGKLTKEKLSELQQSDEYCIKAKERNFKGFEIINKLLIFRKEPNESPRVVVPGILVLSILRNLHDTLHHPNRKELITEISKNYFIPGVKMAADKITNSCYLCTIHRAAKIIKPSQTPVKRKIDEFSTRPRQAVSLDIIYLEADQYPYALIVQDIFSGFLHIQPLKNKSSDSVCTSLTDYFAQTDFPMAVLSDQGTEFGKEVQTMFFKHNILHYQSFAYSQFQNRVESSMKILKQTLRICIDDLAGSGNQHKWQKYCHLAVSHINTRKMKDLGISRHGLYFGTEPNSSYSIYSELYDSDMLIQKMSEFLISRDFLLTQAKELKLEQLELKGDSDNKNIFRVGHIVFIKDHHKNTLKDIFSGPYKITSVQKQGVQMQNLRTNKLSYSHCRYLRPFNIQEYQMQLPKDIIAKTTDNMSRMRISGDLPLPASVFERPNTRSRSGKQPVVEAIYNSIPLLLSKTKMSDVNKAKIENRSSIHNDGSKLVIESDSRNSCDAINWNKAATRTERKPLNISFFNIKQIENKKLLENNDGWRIPPAPRGTEKSFSIHSSEKDNPFSDISERVNVNKPFLGQMPKRVIFSTILVRYF